ncbi:CSN-associated deubiquitinating enzyme Ubp12 [Podochytrium sp. JEL0797]|nr:CSN-associated deubiquitinating enzyme Ubp12 [Podochytrium sp. JEL0797]
MPIDDQRGTTPTKRAASIALSPPPSEPRFNFSSTTMAQSFSPTQLQVLYNELTSQTLSAGQLVQLLPTAFFEQLKQAVLCGAQVPAIISYEDLKLFLSTSVTGKIAANNTDPSSFVVMNALTAKKLFERFHASPASAGNTSYPIIRLNPDDKPFPNYATAEIDLRPVEVRIYQLPATDADAPFIPLIASSSWSLDVLKSTAARCLTTTSGPSASKVKLWDLNSGGAGFGTLAEVENEANTLDHLVPLLEVDSERIFVIAVEEVDDDSEERGLDDELSIRIYFSDGGREMLCEACGKSEFPDSTTVAMGGSNPISFPIKKETPDQKRARIKQKQSGIFTSDDEDSSSKPPLLLGTADPSDPTVIKIPSADAFPRHPTPPAPPKRTTTTGAVGLNNLGNTCFMNSALQCLSNSAHLTSFFLSNTWNDQLNTDNPLGMDGKVALAYAKLVRELWDSTGPASSGDSYRGGNSVAPRNFKSTIGKFNPTFDGYNQQDSQELLQFLLDGLHEDLNRILKKPYVEQPDMDGFPDHEIASKSWEIYRMRNDSQIVDLFQGEYKSRVECLECGQWSVKFDPYMFLSLPVPERREVVVNVIVVGSCFAKRVVERLNPSGGASIVSTKSLLTAAERLAVDDSKLTNMSRSSSGVSIALPSDADSIHTYEQPKKLSLTLPRDATIQSMKLKIAEKMNWKLSSSSSKPGSTRRRLLVTEIYNHKVYKTFQDWDRVSEFQSADVIYVHELTDPDFEAEFDGIECVGVSASKTCYVPVMLSINDNAPRGESSSSSYGGYHTRSQDVDKLFGVPIMIPVPAEMKVSVSVAPEMAACMSDDLWKELVASRLGNVVYELVVKSLQRYTQIGLYQTKRGGEEDRVSGEELVEEFVQNVQEGRGVGKQRGTAGVPPPAPPAPRQLPLSPPGDDEGVEMDFMDATTNAPTPVPAALTDDTPPPNTDPRTGGLFSKLVSHTTDDSTVSIPGLFRLKHIQGERDVGMNLKDDFYKALGGYRTVTKYFELGHASGGAVDAKLYRKRKVKVTEAFSSAMEEDEGGVPSGARMEEEEEDDDGEMLLASVLESEKRLEYDGYVPDAKANGILVHLVSVENGGRGKGGAAEAYEETVRLDGELAIVAEFTSKAAYMLFGDDVKASKVIAFEPVDDLTSPSHAGKASAFQSREAAKSKDVIALDDCLKEFMKEEIMGDDDTWYCPKCKQHQKIKKKLDIWSVPDVLVLHLKRFSQTGRGFRSMSSNKIDALVDFPVTGLDLSDYVIGKEWMKHQESKDGEVVVTEEDLLHYDLFGVSNHFGGMGGGHYTAYAKNSLDNVWYNFDDSHVSKIPDPNSVVTPAAYMLFYQRRSTSNKHNLAEMIQLRTDASAAAAAASQSFRKQSSSSGFGIHEDRFSNTFSYTPYSGMGHSLGVARPSSPSSVDTARSDETVSLSAISLTEGPPSYSPLLVFQNGNQTPIVDANDTAAFLGPRLPSPVHAAPLIGTAGYEFGSHKVAASANGPSGSSSGGATGGGGASPVHEILLPDMAYDYMEDSGDDMPGLVEVGPAPVEVVNFDRTDYDMFADEKKE